MLLRNRRRSAIVQLVGPVRKECTVRTPSLGRSGKWKPLGVKYHEPSHRTLLWLARSLRDGKRSLMAMARQAALTDLRVAGLVEKWDALSAGAQRAVTLTDLCKVSGVAPARFIAAVARAGCQIGNCSAVVALSSTELPPEVELALRHELEAQAKKHGSVERFV